MKTRTAKGTATSNTSGTSLSLASVAIAAGASIIVGLVHDPVAVSSVKWNSIDLTKDREETFAGNVQGSIWSLHNVSAATATVAVTFGSAITAKAMFVIQLAGDQVIAYDRGTSGQGTGTSPSSGATSSTPYDDEFCIGVVGTEAGVGDVAGSWSNSFSAGQRAGVGTDDTGVTVAEGYYQTLVPGAYTAAKTGITSRDWVALIGIYYETGAPQVRTTQDLEHKIWQKKEVQTTQVVEHKVYSKREVDTTQAMLHKVYWAPAMAQVRTTAVERYILWTEAKVESTQVMLHKLYWAPTMAQVRTTQILEHKLWRRGELETTQAMRHVLYIEGIAPPLIEELYAAII